MLNRILLASFFASTAPVARAAAATNESSPPVAISRAAYHGWPDALILRSAQAEVIVVPAIGRVMQFQFVGEPGPFWENRLLDGKPTDPKSADWGNFGGDKTWPSPQADWGKVTPRGWPPPVAFDSLPVEATTENGEVILTSPVDPHYGIRTKRRIHLDADRPVLTITTTFDKTRGEPQTVGVWVITQLRDPSLVGAPIPANTRFPAGYAEQSERPPLGLAFDGHVVSLRRDPKEPHKIGTDAGTLLWVGERQMLRIDSPRVTGAEYPDGGSSAEVYTDPDPLPYVELEMLGPVKRLAVGDTLERTNVYTLIHRGPGDAAASARAELRAQPLRK